VKRRLLVCALTLGASCKRAPAPPPLGPPEIVEVRVVDRTPAGRAPLDTEALGRRAAEALARSSGLRVVDGGSATARARYRLRLEVRLDGAEDAQSKKGVMRAFVDARLVPIGDGLPFEQSGMAERVYDLSQGGDAQARWRAHAERAVADVARTLGARARLAEGSADALVAALDDRDPDLRDEAIRLAAERRERAAVPSLVKLLRGDDHEARDRAIGALAAIGDPRAVRPLTEVARFRDLADLPKVLDALAAIGGDEARAYLEFVASGHDSPEIREMAKKAIGHLDERRRDLATR
jgi:hypothetical protein